jgi:hypothetical protein
LPTQPAIGIQREQLELDARGAGVDDEDRIHGDQAAALIARRRRASA